MEERKFRVGDKVRLTAAGVPWALEDGNEYEGMQVGDVFTITAVDSTDELAYQVDNPKCRYQYWYREEALELAYTESVAVPSSESDSIVDLVRRLAFKCGGYEFQRVLDAAVFIERRHGTTEAMEYLREALGANKGEGGNA